MGLTVKKLEEAGFFLKRMEDCGPDETTFDYYLNAFISAARSVLWVMRYEYGETPGWKAWYDSKQTTADEARLLQRINDLRIRSVKKGTLETKLRMELTFSIKGMTDDGAVQLEQAMRKFAGREMRVTLSDEEEGSSIEFGEDQVAFFGELSDVTNLGQFLDSFPEIEALEACKQYCALLLEWVAECEIAFGESSR